MFHPTLNPAPAPKMYCLLTAFTAMALAAAIHKTDKAVMFTAYRMLPMVKPQYRDVILVIINSPAPLKHLNAWLVSLPASVIGEQPKKPAMSVLNAG